MTTAFGPEYQKINTAWKRNMDVKGNPVMPGEFSQPEFEYLAGLTWRWTEKIDGTNIRLYWDGEKVTLGGRTDRAQIPAPLTDAIRNLGLLESDEWAKKWPVEGTDRPSVTIFGEGYGPGIQKGGGLYRDEPGFIVFDVKIGNWWLRPDSIKEVADGFGLEVVPHAFNANLWLAWEWTVANALPKTDELFGMSSVRYTSQWAERGVTPEGIVGTPAVPLSDRNGKRIIMKLKLADGRNTWYPDA